MDFYADQLTGIYTDESVNVRPVINFLRPTKNTILEITFPGTMRELGHNLLPGDEVLSGKITTKRV